MSPVYYCKRCSISKPCCPVCLKTDVKYICVSRDGVLTIDVTECLDPHCLYGYMSDIDKEEEEEEEEEEDEIICLN